MCILYNLTLHHSALSSIAFLFQNFRVKNICCSVPSLIKFILSCSVICLEKDMTELASHPPILNGRKLKQKQAAMQKEKERWKKTTSINRSLQYIREQQSSRCCVCTLQFLSQLIQNPWSITQSTATTSQPRLGWCRKPTSMAEANML